MIKKLFYCLLFILIIIASLSLWPFIEIPYKETSIIGDYSANKYNPNNDLIRYIIFISIPVLFFFINKLAFEVFPLHGGPKNSIIFIIT